MNVNEIKTEEDYERALEEIQLLINASEGTPESDRLNLLATLVEEYEERHINFPLQRTYDT